MMQFKKWMEMQLVQTIPPNERTKSIWVKQLNNPEQVDAWKRSLTRHVYEFPLNKESFLHFTLNDFADEIVKTGMIEGASVFAVSCSFGIWFPVVQFNHIISKKQDKMFTPAEIKKAKKNPTAFERYKKSGWKIPNFQEEICAVHFTTQSKPVSAHSEEIIWHGPLSIQNATRIPLRDAIRILKNTPHKIGADDTVTYV